MAVFKLNICKFNNCDLIFNNLENLIRHIETNHINYDPKIIEQFETQQPTCLPLSYVLRFFADLPVDDHSDSNTDSKLKQTLLSAKPTPQKLTANANNAGQPEIRNDNSNNKAEEKGDNWATIKNSRAFKNVCKSKKTYKCHCGKMYGSSPSLKKHAIQCHNAAVITAQVKEILQQGSESSTMNSLIQPYQSISLKQISSASTPLKTLVVSTKPSNTAQVQSSQLVQQPQHVMIQLSDLNTITSSS